MFKWIKKDKVINFIYWLLIFIGLMAFFYSSHPLVIFDSDDWLYTSFSRDAIPLAFNWNPTRVLPEILQPFVSLIGAYVIYPIMKDYIMSLALAYGLTLSIVILIYFNFVYKFLVKKINLNENYSKVIILLYICLHFLIYRRLESNNEYIFYSHNVNCIFFYTIPTLLNIIMVLYFEINDSLNLRSIYKKSLLVLLIYLSIFSNLFSSYILGIWAGIKCLLILIDLINNKKSINKELIKNNILYIGTLLLWLISMCFELTGGRSDEISNAFTINSLLSCLSIYIHKYLSLNRLVLLLAFISLIVFIVLSIKKKVKFNNEIWTLLLMFVLASLYIVLLCIKCGEDYFRANTYIGPMIIFLFIILMILSLLIKTYEKSFILIPIMTLILFFNINTTGRTFLDSNYLGNSALAYKFDNYILECFDIADNNGEKVVNIDYPSEWNTWPIYGGYPYANTLLEHKITSTYIDCYMVEVDDFDLYNYSGN